MAVLPQMVKVYIQACHFCYDWQFGIMDANIICPVCNGTGLNLEGLTDEEIANLKTE